MTVAVEEWKLFCLSIYFHINKYIIYINQCDCHVTGYIRMASSQCLKFFRTTRKRKLSSYSKMNSIYLISAGGFAGISYFPRVLLINTVSHRFTQVREQHAVMKFLVREGSKPAETHRRHLCVFRDQTAACRTSVLAVSILFSEDTSYTFTKMTRRVRKLSSIGSDTSQHNSTV